MFDKLSWNISKILFFEKCSYIPYKRTGDISVLPVHQKKLSPVQFFPYVFLKKLSPVLSCSKISRPSFYTGGGAG